jgi:hypothetical protein
MIWSSVIVIFYGKIRPLNEGFLNNMELFNEFTVMISSYMMILFTEFVEDPMMRAEIGWIFVGIIGINIIVNWSILIYKVVNGLIQFVK